MLSKAPAQSVEASVGEEERIRARIEVIGQDNYSSRTGQTRTGQKGKSYVEFAGT